ncbi:hypothetical protein [Evansella cellulosilytica]|uniref:Small CPxCG-related zinc finger protein n=1 Tax=Evansella cellulosilytica (strain ATCC 21833 / DSM 2522 / FERM P-1141 / JCM 9156 / N-4) TaxID=649639 RepID=E6U1T6_EVAC2|nr:hypothetical protein [Evansella cellulosilytica]ADU31583.1 hypothetical protein Bcell_3341 [Evansella cellulosilytica DSM 2522]
MDDFCFYCDNEVGEYVRYGAFVQEDDHIEKALCPDCYHEWLQGIKG